MTRHGCVVSNGDSREGGGDRRGAGLVEMELRRGRVFDPKSMNCRICSVSRQCLALEGFDWCTVSKETKAPKLVVVVL